MNLGGRRVTIKRHVVAGRFRTCNGTVQETDFDSVVGIILATAELSLVAREPSMSESSKRIQMGKNNLLREGFEPAPSKRNRF
jgi:hypothetical protein